MAGLQTSEGCMMIDSVVWAQYINVTDTQTATSPLGDAAPTHWRRAAKKAIYTTNTAKRYKLQYNELMKSVNLSVTVEKLRQLL